MEILKYNDVLSDEQINTIREKITYEVIDAGYCNEESYDVENRIAFGNFVNGICLVYPNESQNDFNELDDDNTAAVFAINKDGNFVTITSDSTNFCGLELNQYNKQRNFTLVDINMYRILQLESDETESTDDFYMWFVNKKLKLTDKILFKARYVSGPNIYGEEVYEFSEEELSDDDNETNIHFVSGILKTFDPGKPTFSYKGNTTNFTNVLVRPNKLLLESSIDIDKNWDMVEGFQHCFSDILIDDSCCKRYGIFDIIWNRFTIHCGEIEHCGGYINGFVKLEFKGPNIYTYDKFDIEKKMGVLYQPKMQQPSYIISIDNLTGCNKYKPVNIVKNPFSCKEGYRNGENAGPLFIIREGVDAGRNISWLKMSKPMNLFQYIKSGYLYIQEFSDFMKQGVFQPYKDRIWLAHDLHFSFEDVTDASEPLYITDRTTRYYGSCEIKYHNKCFEDIIEIDPQYLVAHIDQGNLWVKMEVFDVLHEKRSGDTQYLNQLKIVELSMHDKWMELDTYNEMCIQNNG